MSYYFECRSYDDEYRTEFKFCCGANKTGNKDSINAHRKVYHELRGMCDSIL